MNDGLQALVLEFAQKTPHCRGYLEGKTGILRAVDSCFQPSTLSCRDKVKSVLCPCRILPSIFRFISSRRKIVALWALKRLKSRLPPDMIKTSPRQDAPLYGPLRAKFSHFKPFHRLFYGSPINLPLLALESQKISTQKLAENRPLNSKNSPRISRNRAFYLADPLGFFCWLLRNFPVSISPSC